MKRLTGLTTLSILAVFTTTQIGVAQPAGLNKGFGGNTSGSSNSASGSNSGGNMPTPPAMKSANGKVDFAKANPEDITNENFPNLIESFDYPNADIAEIVKAISKLTGKNFILEKGVSGKISIIAPSQITVAEAYKAFLTALAMNNFTVVPSGNFLKIRSLQAASKESIETYAGNYFPNTDQLITRIVKLKYISAEDVQKTLRQIVNQNGDITPYPPTNSLIVTDLGSNVERVTNIINQLDVPGFEEKLVVMPIKNARAKDIADLIDKIINKGDKSSGNAFTPGIPRFRPGGGTGTSSTTGAASYSLVLPDLRTNSIIVVGNDAGIDRIRGLVAKLDYRLRAEDGSGVYVYYVRYGEAEKIANVLNGIATDATKARTQTSTTAPAPTAGLGGAPAPTNEPIFGADVKVTFAKETNSLVITASRQDWAIVRTILSKIDIPRDQVYVKAYIIEMDATEGSNWGINYYKFLPGGNGIARSSFVTNSSPVNLLDPTKDQGLTLGFGQGDNVTLTPPGTAASTVAGATTAVTGVVVPSLLALLQVIKTTNNANILSAPQLSALDNEEATIEVGEDVPIGTSTSTANNGTTTNAPDRHAVTLKLKLTPYISPDTDKVRLKLNNKIEQIVDGQGINLGNTTAYAYTTRSVDTQIIVNSNDTAVLGGLMQDKDGEKITKIPILGDIPILGWLFKSKAVTKDKTNLLIFITPKIIRSSEDNAEIVNERLDDRLNFVQKYENGRDPYGDEINKFPIRAKADTEDQSHGSSARFRKHSGRATPESEKSDEKTNEKKDSTKDDLEALPPSDDTLGPSEIEEGE